MFSKFQDAGQQFLTLSWSSDTGKEYFSVLVRACGYVVLELMSDTMAEEFKSLAVPSNQRMIWQDYNSAHVASGEYLTPMKVWIMGIDHLIYTLHRSAEL